MIFKLLLDCSEIRVFVKDKKKIKFYGILWKIWFWMKLNEIKLFDFFFLFDFC